MDLDSDNESFDNCSEPNLYQVFVFFFSIHLKKCKEKKGNYVSVLYFDIFTVFRLIQENILEVMKYL